MLLINFRKLRENSETAKNFHCLGDQQWKYFEVLRSFSASSMLPNFIREIYSDVSPQRRKILITIKILIIELKEMNFLLKRNNLNNLNK